MIDWTKPMKQTFEYYIVDTGTWSDSRRINTVVSNKIDWDSEADTLGSSSLTTTVELGECYVRTYLIAIQNGETYKIPLGTFLMQTPSSSYDGKNISLPMDGYTPLMELKEKQPPIGYALMAGENIMNNAYAICSENMRGPISQCSDDKKLEYTFVADTEDTWLSFIKDYIANAKREFEIDPLGYTMFSPITDDAALQPVWEYTDNNSSILYPDLDIDKDIWGIPNIVEIVYSSAYTTKTFRATNNDPNSPTSIQSRGREILYRETNPSFSGIPTDYMLQQYAEITLKNLSTLEYTVNYKHGYCPVKVGDCVLFNYKRANLINVKAKVISQSISCEPGCPVTEKAKFTHTLWR